MGLIGQVQTLVTPTSFGTVLSVILGACTIWYLVSTYIAYQRLKHIPGPPLTGFTSLWWVWASVSEKGHLALADVCTRYGSVARLTPDTVLTDDLDLYRKINAPQKNTYTRSIWYKAFKLDGKHDNLISVIDEEQHMKMRQRLAPGYSGKDNPAAESTIDEVILSLVELLNRKYLSSKSNNKPLDFAETCQYFTLDVITYLSLGKPFGFIPDDSDKYNYIGSLERDWPALNLFSVVPFLAAIIRNPLVQNLLLPKVTDKEGLGKVKAIARERIERRMQDEKDERYDMVTSFLKHGLDRDEIVNESLMQLLAGSDTAATILRTGFLSIVSNPRIYNTLRAEITTHCENNYIPLDKVISNAASSKLPYLQACIKEALRHHPAATGLLPRVVGPEGDTYKGIYLPPGTSVGFCAWNAHRNNTKIHGPDAAIYRPERWLEAPPDQLAKMEEAVYTCFGYGRFRCMGENIARLELNKVWFELLRRFDWALVDPQRPFTKNANYGLFVQKGMWMRVEKREV